MAEQRKYDKYEGLMRIAEISDCGIYRWSLHRSWPQRKGTKSGTVCFVMLNPSTATGLEDDNTIRRCMDFTLRWGYTMLSVRNLFPYRATDPKALLDAMVSLTGGHRGDTELMTAMTAELVIAAWGAFVPFNRIDRAKELFGQFPKKPIYCLGLTKHGKPRHPLYVKADTQPQPFWNCES